MYLTRFFGRQDEIKLIGEIMREERLVTLSGFAGVGKTRLVIMAAEAARKNFPDDIWFISLAELSDPDMIIQHIAQQLGFHEGVQVSALEMMCRYLQSRSALLLIDNYEHLLNSVAGVVEDLLAACPRLVILTTSRQPLGLFGETIVQVPSLPFPPQEAEFTIQEIKGFPAINLFVDRARQVKPDLRIDEQNLTAITHICQRLDGIPLALELAASRVNILSVEELADRLDRAFSLLTRGSRTAVPRHQTLRAALDWSDHLLSQKEAVLFRRLTVFAGGWNLAGAEVVCSGDGIEPSEIITLLSDLIDKSLVNINQIPGQPTRYRMLEVVRQYAEEKLECSVEAFRFQQLHLAYFIKMVEEWIPERRGGKYNDWMLSMDADVENFRKALAFGLESDPRSGLRLACALADYWDNNGSFLKGSRWLKSFLSKPENAPRDRLRAEGLGCLCLLASFEQGSEY